MKLHLLPLLMFICCNAIAQDYVITNAGDTLFGEVKEPLFEHLLYERVVFRENGKRTFYANDIKGYQYRGETFVTQNVGKKNKTRIILKIVVTGPCTLYEHQYVTMTNTGQGAMLSNPQTNFYLQKPGEKLHLYNFALLKNGKDLYFLDNSSLTFDLHQGKYKKRDVKEIVERYNLEKKKTL